MSAFLQTLEDGSLFDLEPVARTTDWVCYAIEEPHMARTSYFMRCSITQVLEDGSVCYGPTICRTFTEDDIDSYGFGRDRFLIDKQIEMCAVMVRACRRTRWS